MTVIGGMGTLLERTHPDEKTRRYCAVIAESMEHMNSMATDLLEFSRGDLHLRKERVRVPELLETIERMNADYLAQQGVAFSCRAQEAQVEG